MSYFSSGEFCAELNQLLGPQIAGDVITGNDRLAGFPQPLQDDLVAIANALWRRDRRAGLCMLSPGDFCTVPELTDEPREEVLSWWFKGDEDTTDFVMEAVDVINGGGGFYVVVHPDGRMGLVCEDPYSFDPLDCNLADFFRALIQAHKAIVEIGVAAGEAVLSNTVRPGLAKFLLSYTERLAPS